MVEIYEKYQKSINLMGGKIGNCLWVIVLVGIVSCKLEQVVSIFRHGARYDTNAVYNGWRYKQFWGELTGVGMAQHAKLGEMLRKEYIENLGLLSKNYSKDQIQIYSTTLNRTILSLDSQIYGLYPPGTGPSLLQVPKIYYLPPYSNKTDYPQHNFAFPYGFQDIPVHSNQHFLQDDCQNQQTWYQKNVEAEIDAVNQMYMTYNPFIKRATQIFNLTGNVTFASMTGLAGNIENSMHLGNPLPQNFTNDDLMNIRHLAAWYHMLTETKDLAKAKNIYKFETIINIFNARIKNPASKLRMTLLSTHKPDIYPLLTDLNFSSFSCIEEMYRKGKTSALNCQPGASFASSIIFELHSSGSVYTIKIRVDGKYMNLCGIESTECKYDDWKNRILKIMGTEQLASQICGTPTKLSSTANSSQTSQNNADKSGIWLQSLQDFIQNF